MTPVYRANVVHIGPGEPWFGQAAYAASTAAGIELSVGLAWPRLEVAVDGERYRTTFEGDVPPHVRMQCIAETCKVIVRHAAQRERQQRRHLN